MREGRADAKVSGQSRERANSPEPELCAYYVVVRRGLMTVARPGGSLRSPALSGGALWWAGRASHSRTHISELKRIGTKESHFWSRPVHRQQRHVAWTAACTANQSLPSARLLHIEQARAGVRAEHIPVHSSLVRPSTLPSRSKFKHKHSCTQTVRPLM